VIALAINSEVPLLGLTTSHKTGQREARRLIDEVNDASQARVRDLRVALAFEHECVHSRTWVAAALAAVA
jgi:hypothetical protein